MASGLSLREGPAESQITFPVRERFPGDEEFQLVIVLVKSFDTESVARSLIGQIGSHIPVLTLQNGLGNAEALASKLQPGQVLAGTTTVGALREAPGKVRLTGRGGCEMGAWNAAGERYLPRTQLLIQSTGLECRCTPHVATTLWRKLAINAVINPLTAILRVQNGKLLEREALGPVMNMIVEEVWRVAARHQIPLPTPQELQKEIRRVCRITAENRSSMLRDVEQGRRTEIESINGAVVRMGREQGIPTPLNAALTGLVQALSENPRRVTEGGK